MKTPLAIALSAFTLAAAGSAFAAQSHASDADYMRAGRCKGLASALGADTSGIDAFLRVEGRTRLPFVEQNAEAETVKAKHEVAHAESKDRFQAELAGPCAAFNGAPKPMASN